MTKPKLKDHHHHHHLLPQNDESESESHHPKLDPESHRQSPSKSKAPKSTPSILHLTLLTTCTLLLLTFAILIIGPSRLLPALDITECAVTPDATNPHLRVYADIPDLERIPGSAPHQQEHGHGHGYEPRTWESMLIPPSGGGIRILPETIADPSPEFPAPNTTHKFGHGIAMFHQLHCLIVLRGVVFPEEGANSTRSTSHHGHGHGGALRGDLEHWAHCFDYIAQALICAADDTVERTKKVVEDGRAYWHVDGVGAMHQCRNARALWEISMRADQDPVDMSSWAGAEGAREFFAEELKSPYQYDVSDIYFAGTHDL